MILSFDKFERYELPQVTLCNPNSRATEVDGKITITDTVGVLSNPKGMNLKLNFNAPHELSFDYYRHKSSDPIKQSFYDSIYEAIQTDRYIYLTDIGYFTIKNSTDSDEDNIDKKSISLKSCEENELATAEGLHLKEGTYYLHTDNNGGLLDLFLPKTAGWTIGFIDPSLLTKPYFVEDTEVDNGYNFLYTTIQDMFECIVEPDIIKRTISVYSRAHYAEHHLTDIHIAKYNLLKHKTVEENDEDKYTALNVQGKDENLEIRAVNPTGKNVIYNFESRYSWMSPALQDAVERWQEKCESVEEEYLTLQQGYYNDMQNIVFPLEEDIKVLEFQLKEKEQTRDTIVYGDYDKEKYGEIQQDALDAVNTEITTVTNSITEKKSTLDDEKNKIQANYSERIDQINSDCALDITAVDIDGNILFTVDLLNELMTHIKPTDYVDEYMLVTESMTYPQRFEKAKELMDRAQSQLVKISSGQKTYSIDTRSFLFNKQFKHFSEQLCAGAIIYVETKSDTMEQLHLTGIDINFDEKSTNFTLGNKYDRSDLKALYEDTLGQNSKSFNELKYIASIVEDQQKYYNRDWAAELRTLTLNNVLTSEDQAIEINNRGLIGRKRQLNEDGSWKTDKNSNPLFESEQIKIINNNIVFTDDNWQSAATAVGKIAVGYNPDGSIKYSYGINAQVLIGKLILGNSMTITNNETDPTITINQNGITILNKNKQNVFCADENGNLELTGTIHAPKGSIGNWQLGDGKLYYHDDINKLGTGMATVAGGNSIAFWAGYTGGYNNPYDGAVNKEDWESKTAFFVRNNGQIKAESGNIAGFTLNGTALYKGTNSLTSTTKGVYVGTDGVRVCGSYGSFTINDMHVEYKSTDKTYMSMSTNALELHSYTANNETTPFSIAFYNNSSRKGFIDDGGIYNASGDCFIDWSGNIDGKNVTVSRTLEVDGKVDLWDYLYVGESITVGTSVVCSKYVRPDTNSSGSVGNSNYKWDKIYATTGTIQTSDRKSKDNIFKLTDIHKQLFMKLIPVSFTFINGTSGRTHIGFISQDVENAMTELGMTSLDFAGFCKDLKTKLYIDESGTEVEVPDLDEYGNEQYLYALRYEEFIAIITYVLQDTVCKLDVLEERLSKIESKLGLL